MPIAGRNYLFKNTPGVRYMMEDRLPSAKATQPLSAISRTVQVIIYRQRFLAPHSVQSGRHPLLHDFGREK